MIRFPKAKINIGLYVTGKRTDGYHNIESLFVPINLFDALEAVKANHTSCNLSIEGLTVEGDLQSNLVVKAWELMHREYGVGGVDAWLVKRIPMGAGLGGGSSDGAHMLCLLNEMYSLGLSGDALQSLAAQLGSDCPFFVNESPAYVSGRGEQLEPVEIRLKGYHLGLIHPGVHVGTKEAYTMLNLNSNLPSTVPNLRSLAQRKPEDWTGIITNDFQTPISRIYPHVADAIERLQLAGAIYTAMSGSGAAVFGIFNEEPEIDVPQGYTFHSCGF
jgi:4-diphosphocytidyl-2-C-methyl-D-erythritol kinase